MLQGKDDVNGELAASSYDIVSVCPLHVSKDPSIQKPDSSKDWPATGPSTTPYGVPGGHHLPSEGHC